MKHLFLFNSGKFLDVDETVQGEKVMVEDITSMQMSYRERFMKIIGLGEYCLTGRSKAKFKALDKG